ncbi:hypothetical protein MXEN_06213 [Mycobacterium xenopi RIVM700367]|uniref:hypothetical protein n=1 Tax=Mycobacterium xenopi TaxID=1789 RepID=UPI00025ADB23|nr:hypothetical protein [Mycobacterium xenopi]EID15784.1 hypothetical protein MXEN_06213 [Mycobacterium xenopi RIVM700367]
MSVPADRKPARKTASGWPRHRADRYAQGNTSRDEASPIVKLAKLAQQAVIIGAGALVLVGAVGGPGLVAQAHANTPQCVANATDPCPPPPGGSPGPQNQLQQQSADQPREHVVCQPAGKVGAFCYRIVK